MMVAYTNTQVQEYLVCTMTHGVCVSQCTCLSKYVLSATQLGNKLNIIMETFHLYH